MAMTLESGREPKRRLAPGKALAGALAVFLLVIPGLARAATVTGTLNASSGNPQPNQQVHFENRVTHDLFLIETGSGGNFSIDLPPGTYDLRTDRGGVVASGIVVDQGDIALGTVKEPGPLSWLLFFRRQGVIRGWVSTPAPSTANIPSLEEAGEKASAASAGQHSSPPAAQTSVQTSTASGK